MIAFQPKGPLLSFTAATSAPTSVQAISLSNSNAQQILVTNVSSTIDVVIGWGQTDAEAKLNAAAGSTVQNCSYVLRGTQVVITAAPNAYISGISVSSTAVMWVQAGLGN